MFDVYQRVKQSIVSIVAHISQDTYVVGTGFIVSEKGHIVTSAHNVLKNKYFPIHVPRAPFHQSQ